MNFLKSIKYYFSIDQINETCHLQKSLFQINYPFLFYSNYEFFLIETKQKPRERFKNRPVYHLARKSREKSNRDSSLECKQQLSTKVRPFQCACRVFLRPKRSSWAENYTRENWKIKSIKLIIINKLILDNNKLARLIS